MLDLQIWASWCSVFLFHVCTYDKQINVWNISAIEAIKTKRYWFSPVILLERVDLYSFFLREMYSSYFTHEKQMHINSLFNKIAIENQYIVFLCCCGFNSWYVSHFDVRIICIQNQKSAPSYNPPSYKVVLQQSTPSCLSKNLSPTTLSIYVSTIGILCEKSNQILPCLIQNKNRHNTVIIKLWIFIEDEDSGENLAQNAHIFIYIIRCARYEHNIWTKVLL